MNLRQIERSNIVDREIWGEGKQRKNITMSEHRLLYWYQHSPVLWPRKFYLGWNALGSMRLAMRIIDGGDDCDLGLLGRGVQGEGWHHTDDAD